MKYTGIGFHPEMVRAKRAGRKNQTRRLLNPQPPALVGAPSRISGGRGKYNWGFPVDGCSDEPFKIKCRYGDVGDRLWMKEQYGFLPDRHPFVRDPHSIGLGEYAGYGRMTERGFVVWLIDCPMQLIPQVNVMNAMFMPAMCARTVLEITDLKAERLQDISEDDAAREGAYREEPEEINHADGYSMWETPPDGYPLQRTARAAFFQFFDMLNRHKEMPDPNPWVWAIGFKDVPEEGIKWPREERTYGLTENGSRL